MKYPTISIDFQFKDAIKFWEVQKSCLWYGMDIFWIWLCRTSYEVLHEVQTVKIHFYRVL